MAAPIRIVGVGSPHGDDKTGWDCAEALQHSGLQQCFPTGAVSIHQSRTPIHLFEQLSGCQYAIIMDALPGNPGVLTWLTIDDLENQPMQHSVHGIGVSEVVQLLMSLSGPSPNCTIIGIGVNAVRCEIYDNNFLQSIIPDLQAMIESRIKNLLPLLTPECQKT